jgi:Tol biopolymer transport system component
LEFLHAVFNQREVVMPLTFGAFSDEDEYRPQRVRDFSALLVAAFLGFSAPAPARAQVVSVNGQIAYVACEPASTPFFPDQCDVWVMDADGTNQTNLIQTTDKNEVGPAWSPDGRRIAYFEGWSEYTLMVMDADGSNQTAHPTTASSPSGATPTWSPGGTRIAFVASVPDLSGGVQADVVTIDLATGAETVVTRPVDFGGVLVDAQEVEPAWSPDGGRIAFASVRPERYPDPITGEPTEGAQWEIVLVDPGGGDDRVVSQGSAGSERADFLEEDRAPAWSPDGRFLVFMSQAQVPSCCGPWQIWAVNRDGTGATNLTNDETVNDMFPSWSPDGSQIVFSRSDGTGGTDLYTLPAPTALPPTARLTAATVARRGSNARGETSAAAGAVRLTVGGNVSDPDWGRNPDTPLPQMPYGLYTSISKIGRRAIGRITSRPPGIRCGRDCSEIFSPGSRVMLSARPGFKSEFVEWSGACSGVSPTCEVRMNDVKTVEARFRRVR